MEKGKFALYDEKFYVKENFDIEQCKKAAEEGNPEAQTSLAECYLGEYFELEKNEKLAYELAMKATEHDIAESYLLIGYFYENGIYVEKNNDKSISFYKNAIKLGCTRALFNLAGVYISNDYEDNNEIKELLEEASDKQHSPSMYLLGLYYEDEKDNEKAFVLYKKATKLGHYGAQTALGLCYLKGIGVAIDEHKAFKLIQEVAVKYDYADALYWLGYFYATGTVVGKDTELANTYYDKAVANGYEPDDETKSNHKTLEDYFNEDHKISSNQIDGLNYVKDKDLVQKSIVYIESERGSGSGFIFNSDGYVATCAHVVVDAKKIFVKLFDDNNKPAIYKAEIIKIDEKTDTAILKIKNASNLKFIELDFDRPEPHCGEEIVILGYPLGDKLTDDVIDLNISFAKGYVSSNQIKDSIKKTMLDISAKHGNSGSPIISNENGKVIGILSGCLVGQNVADEVNYMIPICYLKELLDGSESLKKEEPVNEKNNKSNTHKSAKEEESKELEANTEQYTPLSKEPLKTWANVKRMLKNNFKVQDEENDILAFEFDLEKNNRSQRVFVERYISEQTKIEWISISSCVGLIDNSELDEVLAMLGDNCYGGLIKEEKRHYIRYSLLLETSSEESLLRPIYAIAELADEIEEKYTGGDQF